MRQKLLLWALAGPVLGAWTALFFGLFLPPVQPNDFFFLAPQIAWAGDRKFTSEEVATLVQDIQAPGWPENRRRKLFGDRDLVKYSDMISLNVTKPIILDSEKYAHYFESESIERAVKFSKKWRTRLKLAQSRFGVNKEVIVAVLLVETQLGALRGEYPVLAVFSSVYVDAKSLLGSAELEDVSRARIERKMNWARLELEALLKIANRFKLHLNKAKGSYAGAFGMCQFLPSSYLNFAVSSTARGKAPNLDSEPDAILSVANYLKAHGFKKKLELQHDRNREAIFKYNNSDVYVDTVLGVAERLKKRKG